MHARRTLNVDPLFSRLNPAIRSILRSRLHWIASQGLLLLTVTGRRSGTRYTIPVGYQQEGDRLTILVSHANTKQWWRNYRVPAPVEVRLRGRPARGTARLLAADSAEFRRRAEETFRRIPALGRQFGIRFDRASGLTKDQLAHLSKTAVVVEIDLDPDDDRA